MPAIVLKGLTTIGVGLLFHLHAATLLSQESNLLRLQRCAGLAADSLARWTGAPERLCLSISEHPAAWMLQGELMTRLGTAGTTVLDCSGAGHPALEVTIGATAIRYEAVDDMDAMSRIVEMSVHATRRYARDAGADAELAGRTLHCLLVDTIPAVDPTTLEDPAHPFTKGIPPAAATGGFWSRIVEPAVVLGASIVVVILLFTVRSQ